MRTSQEIDKISEALAAAQAEFLPIKKNKVNPHFKNDYADLVQQITATRPALSRYGIFVFQSSTVINGRLDTITRLLHKSGQWLESDFSLKVIQDTPQGMGSNLSYARRYGRGQALDLAAEDDDDDGEEAQRSIPALPPRKSEIALLKDVEVILLFEKFGVTKKMLEDYVRKPQKDWIPENINELIRLGREFDSGDKDKQGMIDHLAMRDL